ncbi:RHTO0S02e06722g1_1 [Rhodotorula toruloides]|uniref:RHTO0S02e06722g1_1 n=1 Tax=Rhodotorula toruloides TaxID=5286 RepID=A0A061AN33_RHOTO|nr:RHTO0S02e06722g1_1 [Rhodotorula toruloides]
MVVSLSIIGAPGLIGQRHTQHALDEPNVNLTCIVDPTPAGPPYAEKLGVKLYRSTEDMLAARTKGEVRVDAAILATPNATHVPLGIQLVQAGIHTLVEKPFSTDVESGRALLAAEASSSAKILNPYVVNTKKLLDNGKLGNVLAVQGTWACLKPMSHFAAPTEWRREKGTGGVLMINLSHEIDCLRYLFGNITRVYCEVGASTRGFPVDETGAVTLRFGSGVVGTFVFSECGLPLRTCALLGLTVVLAAHQRRLTSLRPQQARIRSCRKPQALLRFPPLVLLFPWLTNGSVQGETVYTVLGTQGSLAFPSLQVWHYPSLSGSWTDPLIRSDPLPLDPTPPFTHQLRHFVDVVEGRAEPRCSGRDALQTIATLEAIAKSIETGLPVEVEQM